VILSRPKNDVTTYAVLPISTMIEVRTIIMLNREFKSDFTAISLGWNKA